MGFGRPGSCGTVGAWSLGGEVGAGAARAVGRLEGEGAAVRLGAALPPLPRRL